MAGGQPLRRTAYSALRAQPGSWQQLRSRLAAHSSHYTAAHSSQFHSPQALNQTPPKQNTAAQSTHWRSSGLHHLQRRGSNVQTPTCHQAPETHRVLSTGSQAAAAGRSMASLPHALLHVARAMLGVRQRVL